MWCCSGGDILLTELYYFFCRSDGKEEKSEGEGKDGKGEILSIIGTSVQNCQTATFFLKQIHLFGRTQ